MLVLHDTLPPAARANELDMIAEAQHIAAALGEFGHQATGLPADLDLAAFRGDELIVIHDPTLERTNQSDPCVTGTWPDDTGWMRAAGLAPRSAPLE